MPFATICESIVLRTHDVGDADRFCILLTKERGKIAARARGVRRLKSRMGGSLLPFQRAAVTISEHSGGFLITGAHLVRDHASSMHIDGFMKTQYVAEILLMTLEDDHPVPETFDLFDRFLEAGTGEHVSVLPFLMQFLFHLGLLPRDARHTLYAHVTPGERALIEEYADDRPTAYPVDNGSEAKNLRALCERIIDNQTGRKRAVRLR